jgi:hypothetical protein
MPRTRRQTISGAPAQAASPVAGQMYGAGVEQQRLAEALPTPNGRSAPAPAAPVPSGSQGAGSSSPAQPVPNEPPNFEQQMAAAGALRSQTGLLTQPTARPAEPVTAGLQLGPGPGPEALQARSGSPAGDGFRRLSQITGDPYFAQLARRAGL